MKTDDTLTVEECRTIATALWQRREACDERMRDDANPDYWYDEREKATRLHYKVLRTIVSLKGIDKWHTH